MYVLMGKDGDGEFVGLGYSKNEKSCQKQLENIKRNARKCGENVDDKYCIIKLIDNAQKFYYF